MSIPERYKDAKYEDVPEQIRKLFESMRETRRGIYIHGAVGTGKTHIVYALAAKYRRPESGRYALVWNMTEMLREIRADFGREPGDRRNADGDVMSFEGPVIIDDVGSEKITDWVSETFYLMVNKRYNNVAPTIFTSNLNPQDLSERVGDRTVSRIVEMCDVVELVGADRRLQNIKPKTKINK